ncbi:ATP-binding protein [Alteromonas hispanica]|uniref:histidine kinase n=1 Tax=Alteromonas hispanica TaxID=315421 RepID=A0A6L9MU85_9ALTE|nr:ATP-binding protein [Alteromonas hispanica]NDW21814.1 response regulator [Alteromonas hispanica]
MEKAPIDKAPSDTISINIRGSKASADTTTKSLRRVGFQLMAVFSLIMIVVIVVARPDNIAIALSLGIWCFVASCAALYCRKHSASIAKLWALVTCPFAPVIVVINGLLPASLIPLMTLFPIVFLTGKWRLCSMLIIAGSTLLVPFHEGGYNEAIWIRLSITNIVVSVLIYQLVSRLEIALAESNVKTVELNRALAKEREASAAQSRFLATMSHEIRTPLNGILGLTDVVLSKEISENARPNLNRIQQSGISLHRILNDVLDVSKLSAGKLSIESAPFDLVSTVNSCVSFYSQFAQNKGIALELSIANGIDASVTGDAVRLSQILNNLISNAIKFTQHGSVSLILERTSVSSSEQVVKFSVVDTGVGINNSEQVVIFEAFTQANSSINRTHGGTGLGLQIVKSLVEAMGGNVSLNSEVGKGSTFSFELAFSLAKELGDTATRSTTEPSTEPSTKFSHNTQPTDQETNALGMSRGSVLVVDDNEINRVVAQSLLEDLRVGVTLASSGEEALILVSQQAFDLILMDLQMPEMTGAETTLELRNKGVNTPVVAFTASIVSDEIDKAMSSGMSCYITKPVDVGKLTTVIDRYLPR